MLSAKTARGSEFCLAHKNTQVKSTEVSTTLRRPAQAYAAHAADSKHSSQVN